MLAKPEKMAISRDKAERGKHWVERKLAGVDLRAFWFYVINNLDIRMGHVPEAGGHSQHSWIAGMQKELVDLAFRREMHFQ